MRWMLMALACAGSWVGVPSAAWSQLAPGRSGSSTVQTLGAEEHWLAVRSFGRCYAVSSTERALQLMATEPGSREERAFFSALFRATSHTCLGDVTRMSLLPAHLRGSIAEGLIRRGRGIPAALMLRPIPAGQEVRTISDAARCYTAEHASEVRALVAQTVPGSGEEFRMVERIAPDFFRCVPANARNYRFATTDLRYRLAEALLRMHPPVPGGS